MRAALPPLPLDGFSGPRPVKDGSGRRPPNDALLVAAGFLEVATVYARGGAIAHLSRRFTFGRSGGVAWPRLTLTLAAEFPSSRKSLAALPSAGEC
jgi:hypothetical protein